MKNRIGLAFALVFMAPGIYAICSWFMLDAGSQRASMLSYRSVLGLPEISFTKQILGLLLLGMAGFYIAAKSKDGERGMHHWARNLLLIVGAAECSMLAFSLM